MAIVEKMRTIKWKLNRRIIFCNTFINYSTIITGLPVRPSHKMGFRSSVSKSGLPGEGRHKGLVRRNDVLTNGFI